jgi:hypothetical protein
MAAFPHAAYRIYSKRGDSDCAIAAMATVFRRDYEEVLIAAAKVAPHAWKSGLTWLQMRQVARRLKVKTLVRKAVPHLDFDMEDETGVLWVGHHDSTNEHCVVLLDGGWIIDPEYNPAVISEHDDYLRVHNAYPGALLQVVE